MHTISLNTWVALPNEVRYRMRDIFNIPRSTNTMVIDGTIESDGTTHEDIQALTVEKMQKYAGSDSQNLHELFDITVAKVNDELQGKPTTVVMKDAPITVIIEPKKRGRPSKK